MKNWLFIMMLFLCKHSVSQDTCLPVYRLPVKKLPVNEGVSVGYVETGKGKTIVLLHGLGGNLSHWLPTVKLLAANYHVIAMDFPGYGASASITTDTSVGALDFYANAVAQFIEKKQLKQVTLAGHSMGGQVAVITALQHPEVVAKLILLAPAGLETFTQQEAAILITATNPAVIEKQEEPAIRASYKVNFYEMPQEAEALIQDRLRLKNCPEFKRYTTVVSSGVKGMLAHPVKEELKNIKQPTLILFGENDALIPNPYLHPALKREAMISEATATWPNAKVITLPKAGHLLPFEKPIEVYQAIHAFVK